MHQNTAADEVIRRLNTYYDMPQLIEDELETIRHAEEQRGKIVLPAQRITGLPGGKGTHGDQTANLATSSTAKYYDDEIKICYKRIAALRSEKDWCTAALASLSRLDRKLIELAYLGPEDPVKRRSWIQRPTWYAIAAQTGVSEAYARIQASRIIFRLADNLDQIPLKL